MNSSAPAMLDALASPDLLVMALAIAFVAGLVKGTVGFALPIILVSGLATLFSPHAALAGVVVPSVIINLWQALRQGAKPAIASTWKFRRFLAIGLLVLVASAQLVPHMAESALLMTVSIPIILFATVQLLGWRPRISSRQGLAEYLSGIAFGLFSGLAALFAPALVFYLTAIDTEKKEQMRVQGVVFAIAAIFFFIVHLFTGVLSFNSLVFSTVLLVPSLLGMRAGLWLHDHIDQKVFRSLTLVVLLISGLNLLRRAFFI